MGMTVPQVIDNTGLARVGAPGDGWFVQIEESADANDSNQTMDVVDIQSGVYVRSGMTAARSDTTPTAVAILAANPNMDIGDSFIFAVSVTVAFAWNIVAGAGVTLAGKTQVPASGFGFFKVTKTAAATVTIRGL